MLPFIVALIFAVGLPLLPSSLHRALHLPALNFNFLSARHAPEQLLVSSPEPTLLLESSYSKASPDSGGSSQYLVFSDISGPDCWNDAASSSACMSLTEKQDPPQTSIWNTIHAQLLYQLVEATIIMTLSFFAAATLFPRHCLRTLLERFCTALFISRQYSPKAALSSFLQDVFSGLHRYWMVNSVAKRQAPKSADDTSWLAALEVFADISPGESSVSSVSVSVRQDHLDLAPSDMAELCFERSSSSVSSISPPQPTKISPPIDTTCTPLLDVLTHSSRSEIDVSGQEQPQAILGTIVKRDPPHITPPSVITQNTNRDIDISNDEASSHSVISPLCPLDAPRPSSNTSLPVPSHLRSSTESFPSISMKDLYNAARRGAAASLLSEPSRGVQEANASDPSANSYSSCDHESGTTPDPEAERFRSESNSISSLRSQDSRRRYKSDSIQVSAASCHIGNTAAPLAPTKVDATCAFWKCAPPNGEGKIETLMREASGSGSLGSWAALHITGNRPELADGSPTAIDTALTGIVITPEGMQVVPASQRSDGSVRREIRVRPGHALREPLAEKYRPPAARRRTSTWDPNLREYTGSPSLSSHLHDSPLPSTPKGTRPRLFERNDSPASLADNWRRSSSGPTVEGTPSTAALTPSMEVKLSPAVVEVHEGKAPKTSISDISTSPMITTAAQATVPVSNVVTPIQFVDQLLSRSAVFGSSSTKSTTEIIKEVAEVTEDSNSEGRVSRADLQQEEPSPTHYASTDAKEVGRRPLQDITVSISVPGPRTIEYQALPLRTTTTKQVTDTFLKEVLKAPILISEGEARETTVLDSPRKRKPSTEPNALWAEVLQPTDTPTPPHRLPRARRSAPHLGKFTYNNNNNNAKQYSKMPRAAQTPDGSKRRRTRTASARGVENWNFNVSWTPPTTDRNGQIVLPAGMGWKGRSSVGAGPGAMVGQQQRQRQPTPVIV